MRPGDPLNPIHYSGCFPEFGWVQSSSVSVFWVGTYVRLIFSSVFPCPALFG